MKKCYYSSIKEVVDLLNISNVPYLILRNYENLLNDEIYVSGHEDIDLLCEKSEDIVRVLNAEQSDFHKKGLVKDRTHYYIYIANKKVDLDLRHLGDGYYCEQWERDMLRTRVLYNGFYVPNKGDYFYSLTYHAILQKKVLTEEYKGRLWTMAKELQISLETKEEQTFIKALEKFMSNKGYVFTYTSDFYIPLQFQKVRKQMVVIDCRLQFQHFLFHTKVRFIEALVKVKHLLLMKK